MNQNAQQKNPKALTLIDSTGNKYDVTGLNDSNYRAFHGASPFTGDQANTITIINDEHGNAIGMSTTGGLGFNIALAINETDLDAMMMAHAKHRGCKLFGSDGKQIFA